MRKALGSIPSVSISARQMARCNSAAFAGPNCGGNWVAHLQFADWAAALVAARLAQPAERTALNLVVVGSSPTVGAFRERARTYTQRGAHTATQVHT